MRQLSRDIIMRSGIVKLYDDMEDIVCLHTGLRCERSLGDAGFQMRHSDYAGIQRGCATSCHSRQSAKRASQFDAYSIEVIERS